MKNAKLLTFAALLCAFLAACAGFSLPSFLQPSSARDDLDAAIRETSNYLNGQLASGNKLMIVG